MNLKNTLFTKVFIASPEEMNQILIFQWLPGKQPEKLFFLTVAFGYASYNKTLSNNNLSLNSMEKFKSKQGDRRAEKKKTEAERISTSKLVNKTSLFTKAQKTERVIWDTDLIDSYKQIPPLFTHNSWLMQPSNQTFISTSTATDTWVHLTAEIV